MRLLHVVSSFSSALKATSLFKPTHSTLTTMARTLYLHRRLAQPKRQFSSGLYASASLFLFLILPLFSPFTSTCFGYNIGISSFPLSQSASLLTTEFVGLMSNGTGVGIQARFTKKLVSNASVEGGLGFADSKRTGKIFLAGEAELFPDYDKQPRVAIKGFWENVKEYELRKNILGVSPLVSKGFNVGGFEYYPFLGLPIGLSLDDDTKSYEVRTQMALGFTGQFPMEGYHHLLLNLEGNLNLANSFSGVYLGLTYPLN